MDTTLTFRQERFALEYLKDQNASAAAARAGYAAKNMAAQGHELLNNPAIRERVRMEMEAMLAEIRCSALALMKQRMKAAFFDAGKLFKGGRELRLPEELDEETRAAVEVTSVTRKSGPVVKMKQPDRNRALRALERVHERLDRLNEAHYAALEKAGKVPTLAELTAREEEQAPTKNAEKCRVLSGGMAAPDLPHCAFAKKDQVLSGSVFRSTVAESPRPAPGSSPRGTCPSTGSGRTVVGRETPEKDRVLSGLKVVPGLPRHVFTEKDMVLSGSQWRLSPLAAAVRGVTQALAAA